MKQLLTLLALVPVISFAAERPTVPMASNLYAVASASTDVTGLADGAAAHGLFRITGVARPDRTPEISLVGCTVSARLSSQTVDTRQQLVIEAQSIACEDSGVARPLEALTLLPGQPGMILIAPRAERLSLQEGTPVILVLSKDLR